MSTCCGSGGCIPWMLAACGGITDETELEQGLDVGALDPHHRKLEVRTVAWSRKGPTLKWTYGQSALVSMAAGYKQRSCDRVRRSLVVDGFALPSTPSA